MVPVYVFACYETLFNKAYWDDMARLHLKPKYLVVGSLLAFTVLRLILDNFRFQVI